LGANKTGRMDLILPEFADQRTCRKLTATQDQSMNEQMYSQMPSATTMSKPDFAGTSKY
jgi:hypothetical protein